MSAKKVFVAGLPWETTQEELYQLIKPYGKIVEAKLILDRDTGKSKGFGFVEMSTEEEAKGVIRQLDGSYVGTRKLFVNEYKAKAVEPGEKPRFEKPRHDGPRPDTRPAAPPPPGPPGGVERRSGVERRKNAGEPGAPRAERREFKKPWADKKPFGERKPWQKDKPSFGDKKPWQRDKSAFGEKKPWQRDKPAFGEKKPWQKDKPAFGEKKPWQKDKPAFGEKKPWADRKPVGFGENKKPWEEKPWDKDKKPGGFGKKPWAKKPFGKKPGGFRKPSP